jgi:transposase
LTNISGYDIIKPMKLHGNAALTIIQRREVKKLHEEEKLSYRKLAEKFGVNVTTISRWARRDSPLDLSTTPRKQRSGLTQEQKEAIKEYKKENPKAGARTIASVLSRQFGHICHSTISLFLKTEGLNNPPPVKKEKERQPLKVGKHRLQMDFQTLPAIRGQEGFEYKITIIHMATRMKYSEIHQEMTSEVAAQALKNALAHLPPFFFSVD